MKLDTIIRPRGNYLAALFAFILFFAGCSKGEEKTVPADGLLKEDSSMIKYPELAGTWYPGNEADLRSMIGGFMDRADVPTIDGRIVGIISPHAGLVHSGPTAAYGYKLFLDDIERYRGSTIIMIGPNHRNRGFSGISVWARGKWASPLGTTPIDEALADSILEELGDYGGFEKSIYRQENSLEVQLPFIQYVFGDDVKIVPILFGLQTLQASRALADILIEHSERKDIIIVASSDLSHYHDLGTANGLDAEFIDAVTKWDVDSLVSRLRSHRCEACGFGAVLTLMMSAAAFGADTAIGLNHSTSADGPSGDPSSVVGYFSGAFVDTTKGSSQKIERGQSKESPSDWEYSLTEKEKLYLLKLARKTIEDYVKNGVVYEPPKPDDPKLAEDGAVFVTLHREGMLRGCIGQMIPQGPLYLAVRDMAISAATRDHRFRPVSEDELDKIDIEISVLSPMHPIDDWHKIELGHHGVWLRKGYHSGVFLPQVGRETGWTLEMFLEELSSQKAGLPRNAYKDPDTKLFIFTVVEFDEPELGLK